jgi:DNA-binding PadR family transcriptional regulator
MARRERSDGRTEPGDARAIHDLIGFQRDLLAVIAGLDRPSGQRIKTELEATSNQAITHGRLYPNLDTLVDRDLVRKGELDRRTNYYAVTDAGVESLRRYHEWAGAQLP